MQINHTDGVLRRKTRKEVSVKASAAAEARDTQEREREREREKRLATASDGEREPSHTQAAWSLGSRRRLSQEGGRACMLDASHSDRAESVRFPPPHEPYESQARDARKASARVRLPRRREERRSAPWTPPPTQSGEREESATASTSHQRVMHFAAVASQMEIHVNGSHDQRDCRRWIP